MRLRNTLSAVAAVLVIGACVDSAGPTQGDPQFLGDGPQGQARGWFEKASPVVMALPATVFADEDEATGRLRFGVEHAAAAPAVRNALARLGVPAASYVIEVTAPIYQVATLRDQWRPTQGGIQIHFGNFLCTMGFNADDGTQRSFITNSHCSGKQGGVQNTQYFQPTSTVDPTVIATEVEDPNYFRGGQCPRGRKCRFSDSARALYGAGTASTRGVIARTSGPNNGSIDVTGTFTITSQDNTSTSFSGTVNKVGRTTGWTSGTVTATCATVNVSGTNITQLCQTLVQDPGGASVVGGGDSGSGVFQVISGSNVQLIGILWGGSSDNKLFVFSPLASIQQELGALVATN